MKKSLIKTLIMYYFAMLLPAIGINLAVSAVQSFKSFEELKNSPDKSHVIFLIVLCAVFILAAAASVVIGAVKKLRPHSDSYSLGLTLALVSYLFTETCMGAPFAKDSMLFGIAAPVFMCLLYLVGSGLFKSPKIYFIILTAFFHVYGVAQYFVFSFRGAPVRPSDINNIASAFEISSDYSFGGGPDIALIAYTVLSLAACIAVTVFAKIEPLRLKIRLITAGGAIAVLIVFCVLSTRLYSYGVENRIIRLNFSGGEDHDTYRVSGNVLMFYLDAVNGRLIKPSGYSDDRAIEILSRYDSGDKAAEKTPTVIAIMDESFADFARLGSFETDKDYMPFYHSLSDNAIKGFVTVSAYGGYSCNSEFEFLTGNTMGFFPMGSAAYTQYLKTQQDSLVGYFNDLGYDTLAMAGCSKNLWRIGDAYGYMGFDRKLYQSDISSSRSKRVNGRVSDEALFDRLIEEYNAKEAGKPMFVFMTTMQNHSPYKLPADPAIKLEDIDNDEAQAYLSYAYETDKALQKLVTYFSRVDEDVVIVFYGDHYPHIPEFSEELLGESLGTRSAGQNALIHQTPFMIWANYDIEEQQGVEISLNYLSNKLVEVCGTPKTDCQLFLDDVMAQVPSISAFGYMGISSEWFRAGDSSEYSDILNEYNIVQYYRIFKKYD